MALFGPPNIEKLTEKHDVKGLVKALGYQKDPAIQRAAFDALLKIGEGWKACLALGNSADSTLAVPLLKLVLVKDKILRSAAVTALEMHHWQPDKSLAAACFWVEKGNFEKCADIGEVAVAPLRSYLWDHKDYHPIQPIRALGSISGPEAIEAIDLYLSSRDRRVQIEAVAAMVQIGNPAVDILIKNLSSTGPFGSGAAAAEALGKIGNSRAVKPLLDAVENAPEYSAIKIKAIEALGKIGNEAAMDKLIYYASFPGSGQKAAQTALKAFGQKPVPALIELMKGSPSYQRAYIAEALAVLRWQPGKDEFGAVYWAALHEWEQCARIGSPAVGVLIEALERNLNAQQSLSEEKLDGYEIMESYMNDDSPGHSTYKMEREEREQKYRARDEATQAIGEIVNSLVAITGQKFGADVNSWKDWWEKNRQPGA
jgi:HEAT repeat protein